MADLGDLSDIPENLRQDVLTADRLGTVVDEVLPDSTFLIEDHGDHLKFQIAITFTASFEKDKIDLLLLEDGLLDETVRAAAVELRLHIQHEIGD